jgi:hypothetical protein
MLRRDFLVMASAVPLAGGIKPTENKIEKIIGQLEIALREELPDIKDVQIKYDPKQKKIPLMIVAFRA